MKKYRVVVDGTEYEIGIEAMDSQELLSNTKEAADPLKSEVSAQSSVPLTRQAAGEVIKSPMPGNILKVLVSEGDHVKKGQVLMILEAMKMENEIIAPRDAFILSVNVQSGVTVQTGTALCKLQ